MGKIGIIHVADLHMTDFSGETEIKSRISENNLYLEKFVESVKDNYPDEEITWYMVVAGDIANAGKNYEYAKVKIYIEEIVKGLGIDKKNVLLVPGNHDINHTKLMSYCDDSPKERGKTPGLYTDVKFEHFSQFYSDFFEDKKTFDTEKMIIDMIEISSNFLLVGLNSSIKESYQKKDYGGAVDYEVLKKELNILNAEKNKSLIGVFHHNPDIKAKGGFDKWDNINELLNHFNMKTFMFGHTHTQFYCKRDENFLIGVGSLAKKDSEIMNSFNIIIGETEENSIKCELFNYRFIPGTTNSSDIGKWLKVETAEEFILTVPNVDNIANATASSDLMPEEPKENTLNVSNPTSTEENTSKQMNSFVQVLYEEDNEKLFELIQKPGIYKSGHFHWSEVSRSHSWLDIGSLLSSLESRKVIKSSLINYFNNQLPNKEDVTLICIGMEGVILGSLVKERFDFDITYLPHSEDHNKHENGFFFKNNIILMADIIYQGYTISAIYDRIKEVNPEANIKALALYYVGKKDHISALSEHEDISCHALCNKVKVEDCGYKETKDCIIFMNKLDTVIDFQRIGKIKEN